MSTIQIQDVSKYYGTVHALDSVSVTLEGERIYGLLGRNGAGKTTLINVVTNRVTADSGSVTIDGEPVMENDRVLSQVCCMSGKVAHPGEMRVAEGFRWSREFYPGFETEYAKDLAHRFDCP
jgi:ABC-2 type transport system ATP-binding protein